MKKDERQAKSKAIQSIIFQARHTDGRLSEQHIEIGTADLIDLLANRDKPSVMIYPDYGPLLDNFKAQIKFQMQEQHGNQQGEKYQLLHNQWRRASTYRGNTALTEWQYITHTAEELLISLKRDMPRLVYNYQTGQIHETDKVHHHARMFTDSLLYSVTARAALQRETFKNDPVLSEHAEYIRNWLLKQMEVLNPRDLILEAAIDFTAEEYLLLQDACGESRSRDEVIKAAMQKSPKQHSNHWSSHNSTAHYGVEYTRHSSPHWKAANMVRNMLYRLERISALMLSLSETEIDFDSSDTTTEKMKENIESLISAQSVKGLRKPS